MKLGVVVEAISTLKILGPVLQHAGETHLPLVVLIPQWRKGKPYDTVTPELLRQTFPSLTATPIVAYERGELAAQAVAQGVTHLCLLNPYRNFANDVPKLAAAGVAVFGLDYFVNSVYVAASQDSPATVQASLNALTARLVASEYWRDLEFTIAPAHRRWADRFAVVGSPLLDGASGLDPESARTTLRLSSRKPIVALFTPNIRDHQAYFFYGPATWYKLRRFARQLRAFCDARGYQLVVKSRAKQWDATPFIAVADVFLQDLPGQVYPSTSALLLSTTTLAIHFGSLMVLEAAAARVPSVAVAAPAVDKLHGYMRPEVRHVLRQELLEAHPHSLFDYETVTQSMPLWLSTTNLATRFDAMIESREDATPHYHAYNQYFSGYDSTRSAAERIIGAITDRPGTAQSQRTTQLAAHPAIARAY